MMIYYNSVEYQPTRHFYICSQHIGFDRTANSNLKRNTGRRKWKWYQDLMEQRVIDIETEMV